MGSSSGGQSPMDTIAGVAGLVLLLACDGAAASSAFKPDCTLPPPGTNYVSGPNVRSTLSILWNCLSLIILCTWSIQHLNVPVMRPESNSLRLKLRSRILAHGTKVKWMILAVLSPEYLVGRALGEWLSARSMLSKGWNLTEAYMANMGYFVLDVGVADASVAARPQDEKQAKATVAETAVIGVAIDEPEAEREPHISRKEVPERGPESGQPFHSTPLPSSDSSEIEILSESNTINLHRLKHRFWALTAEQWHVATEYGIADPRGVVLRSQLRNLDKGGTLVKALALIQVIYLVVQLIARKIGGLPSSQLEIATLAFAASSAVTYLLYWSRPQGVETIHIIKPRPRDQPQPLGAYTSPRWDDIQEPLERFRLALAKRGPSYLWLGLRLTDMPELDLGPMTVPNDSSHFLDFFGYDILNNNEEIATLAFGSVVGGVLFGGLHCLAWNFEFPTPIERTLWRICALLTTVLPVVAVMPLSVWIRLNPWGSNVRYGRTRIVVAILILFGFIVPYVLARLVIIVEVFRTLCFLPPEAYIDTWSGSFPKWD